MQSTETINGTRTRAGQGQRDHDNMNAVPTPKVTMIGGGQLARMTHQAAIALGQTLRVLAVTPDDPAAQVTPDVVIGSHTYLDALRRAVVVDDEDCGRRQADHRRGDEDAGADGERLQVVAAAHRDQAEEEPDDEVAEWRVRDRPRAAGIRHRRRGRGHAGEEDRPAATPRQHQADRGRHDEAGA